MDPQQFLARRGSRLDGPPALVAPPGGDLVEHLSPLRPFRMAGRRGVFLETA
jgi:hypothetical protein